MPPKNPKKKFGWKPGEVLGVGDYDPLGGVREVGFSKLADGVYADPQLRKQARRKKITQAPPVVRREFLVEESASGLSDKFSPTTASQRLLHKDSKDLKGIRRFKGPKKS